jgi:hypothetical protein
MERQQVFALNERIRQLADLLVQASQYEAADLNERTEWRDAASAALAAVASDHLLETELRDLLAVFLESEARPGFSYAVDRAVAEAKGLVDPGGAIEYQERWQDENGNWSPWRTFRTATGDHPTRTPQDAVIVQNRIASASRP